ncbi:MAG: YwaF family protein [Oscillospiraceae bacterium]|nr:YwaF family protein [Oscillospiraceae bacterium]
MFTGDYGFFDYKYNITGYAGQDYGGPAQTVYLIASAVLLVLLLLILRGSSRERVRRIVGFTGVFLTLFYLGKTAWESYYDIRLSGAFNTGILPLDTCSIVMPAALLAGFGRGRAQRLAESWLATGGVVGGIGTMVRLNAFNFYPFLSFGGLYSMLWHLLMVFLGLLLIVTDENCCGRETVHRGFLFHLVFSAFVIPVDFIWDFDFMLYRCLGGVPVFEGVASRLTEAGLVFLNPLLMLLLYYLAFWLVSGTAWLIRRIGRRKA